MVALGILPKQLVEAKTPKCSLGMHRSLTKWLQRTKGRANLNNILPTKKPDDYVSFNMIELRTPGFIAQLRSKLARRRCNYAMVFIDHHSGLLCIHLHKSNNSNSMLEAQQVFKAFAAKSYVKIRNYYSNNGRFSNNLFLSDAKLKRQTILRHTSNTHHQKGRVERVIRNLTDKGRTSLLHSICRQPAIGLIHLQPYAI